MNAESEEEQVAEAAGAMFDALMEVGERQTGDELIRWAELDVEVKQAMSSVLLSVAQPMLRIARKAAVDRVMKR